ncbi:hypothetical protein CPB86DRAFT_819432 [Serendipita vermifera]|nr:hypothetical protein CPB86DRAFT_819432 [Serendipita vermifera]
MEVPPMQRVPVELWEKILLYAIASPFLPFTESGRLSPHLVDIVDLFRWDCIPVTDYRDDSLATIGRLRLVCRSWSIILQPKACEYAESDLKTYYYPSKQAVQRAIRLNLGPFTKCPHVALWRRPCALGGKFKDRIHIKMDEDILLQTISPNLKILLWDSSSNPTLELPIKALSNLNALSIYTDCIPSWWSLKALSLAAPRLGHLRLRLFPRSSYVLSEAVVFPSLTYLCLHIGTEQHPQAFRGWRFPSLCSLELLGAIAGKSQIDFEDFLARHGNTITELDAHKLTLATPSSNLFTSSRLWKLCPKVNTIAGELTILKLLRCSWELQGGIMPRLTFLVRGNVTRSTFFSDLRYFIRGKGKIDNEKIIYYRPWRELGMSNALNVERTVFDLYLKNQLDDYRKDFKDVNFSIVDRNGVPLSDAVEELLSLTSRARWLPRGLIGK